MLNVVELRRYTVNDRPAFARIFETFFPEAFQQLGATIAGHFLERGDERRFTWLRGFPDLEARARVNQAFYEGPVWAEHRSAVNDRLIDHTDVLQLRPLRPLTVLPAVAPDDAARGIVVAQILPGGADAEPLFAAYRDAGAREAGLLESLDAPNNYPRLAVRTDGPFLVWLGVVADEAALARIARIAAPGERVVMDPAARSRLRWVG